MKDFILSHITEVIVVIVSLINLLITLLKKKYKVIDTPLTKALVWLPDLIIKAESLGFDGQKKKSFVLTTLIAYLVDLTGLDEAEIISSYQDRLDEAIERILSTPTKKEVK